MMVEELLTCWYCQGSFSIISHYNSVTDKSNDIPHPGVNEQSFTQGTWQSSSIRRKEKKKKKFLPGVNDCSFTPGLRISLAYR
jgi:hypothetical protein